MSPAQLPFCRRRFVTALCAGLCLLSGARIEAQTISAPSDWMQRATPLIQSVLQRRHVAGMQLAFFDHRGIVDRSFGFSDVDGSLALNEQMQFAAGELVRPIVALAALEELQRGAKERPADLLRRPLEEIPDLPRFVGEGAAAVTFASLFNYSSGLPPSRAGLIFPASSADDRRPLAERLQLASLPQTRIAWGPEGFAWLGEWLRLRQSLPSAALALQRFARLRRGEDFCFERNGCRHPLVSGLEFEGRRFFQTPQPEYQDGAAWQFYTSARAYASFLQSLLLAARRQPDGPEATLLAARFSYDPLLGGAAAGMRYMRPAYAVAGDQPADPQRAVALRAEQDIVYVAEHRQPGYCALAFVDAQGRGAVALANADDPDALREVVRYLWRRLGILQAPPEAASVPESSRALNGLYWPRDTLPPGRKLWRFLNEIRVQRDRQGLEFASVFQKNTAAHLQWLGLGDLYIARGEADMEGWRALVRRDAAGDVIGIDTDLVRYERRWPLFSAWSIIIGVGLVPVLPILFLIVYFVFRKKAPGKGAA
ncbi:MAG: serine hydrolase [Leptospirales bacterium]|nr:serine hydrolase [Leptospirales bacterium]